MARYENDGKVLRFRVLFNESGMKNANQFAKEVGSNQPTVAKYLAGDRQPTAEFLLACIKRFDGFSQEWLLEGKGEKYDRKTVVTGGNNVIAGNNNNGDNKIIAPTSDKDGAKMAEKLESMYREMIDILKAQVASLTKSCSDKDKQLEIYERLLESKNIDE